MRDDARARRAVVVELVQRTDDAAIAMLLEMYAAEKGVEYPPADPRRSESQVPHAARRLARGRGGDRGAVVAELEVLGLVDELGRGEVMQTSVRPWQRAVATMIWSTGSAWNRPPSRVLSSATRPVNGRIEITALVRSYERLSSTLCVSSKRPGAVVGWQAAAVPSMPTEGLPSVLGSRSAVVATLRRETVAPSLSVIAAISLGNDSVRVAASLQSGAACTNVATKLEIARRASSWSTLEVLVELGELGGDRAAAIGELEILADLVDIGEFGRGPRGGVAEVLADLVDVGEFGCGPAATARRRSASSRSWRELGGDSAEVGEVEILADVGTCGG